MADAPFHVRAGEDRDRLPLATLFAAVAEERDGIATEPPVDIEARAASWTLDGTLVAVARAEIIGSLHVEPQCLSPQRARNRSLPQVRVRRRGTARHADSTVEW